MFVCRSCSRLLRASTLSSRLIAPISSQASVLKFFPPTKIFSAASVRHFSKEFDGFGRESDDESGGQEESVIDPYEDDENIDTETNELLHDTDYKKILPHQLQRDVRRHNVLLIQPKPKYGAQKSAIFRAQTTPELMMDEAVALVNTLPGWNVVRKELVPATNPTKTIFGTGNLEKIEQWARSDPTITAVFIATDTLSGAQQATLEEVFGLPVFDRYSIVLRIFTQRAKTREAKLQVSLAEIPYLKARLRHVHENHQGAAALASIGGVGESYFQQRQMLLNRRQQKLLEKISQLRKQRQRLRKGRKSLMLPTVAVVGYTNCGKTTLIKALTGDAKLKPEDRLFATLDVTVHEGRLMTNNSPILYVDTVGFISNIPTTLIEAFNATLEEVRLASAIVHVRDLSNPNHESQRLTVQQTLKTINVPPKLRSSIIEVGNKIDLVENPQKTTEHVLVSAVKGTGLDELSVILEQRINENTGSDTFKLVVRSGGEEYMWLLKQNAGIKQMEPLPEDPNMLVIYAVLNPATVGRIKKNFPGINIENENQQKASL